MSGIREKITDLMIDSKVKPVISRLNESLNFPIKANAIRKVLVILPRNMEMIDHANRFVTTLRKRFPHWRVELFDIDKLNDADLNRMRLPKDEIINKLKKAGYQFVIDMDASTDFLSSLITLMTEATYRLSICEKNARYYNLIFQPHQNGKGIHYKSLLDYLNKLFVKNSAGSHS